MNPCSRSPWADWLRFMKSMSIVAQGMSRLCCVWRWQRGLASSSRPPIHILEGLKVCIQVTMPAQAGSALAARMRVTIASGPFSTGFQTRRQGRVASRAAAMDVESLSTCARVSSP